MNPNSSNLPYIYIRGFHEDQHGWRWMGKTGVISVDPGLTPNRMVLQMRCAAEECYPAFPLSLQVYINKKLSASQLFTMGNQTIETIIQIPHSSTPIEITIVSACTFSPSPAARRADESSNSIQLFTPIFSSKPEATPLSGTSQSCNICGSSTGFDLTNPDNPRESWVCRVCASTSRDRMYILALAKAMNFSVPLVQWKENRDVQILEAAGARAHPNILMQKYSYWNTKYDPDLMRQPGYDPYRFADFQSMPYRDQEFDVVMSSDVFEHIRLHKLALDEVYRVLKTGGVMILQAPFMTGAEKNMVLVDINGEEDIYLYPPQYHDENTLVYRVYGAELITELEQAGFSVEVIEQAYPDYCITYQNVIIARKMNIIRDEG